MAFHRTYNAEFTHNGQMYCLMSYVDSEDGSVYTIYKITGMRWVTDSMKIHKVNKDIKYRPDLWHTYATAYLDAMDVAVVTP